jgi:hypothetical protein
MLFSHSVQAVRVVVRGSSGLHATKFGYRHMLFPHSVQSLHVLSGLAVDSGVIVLSGAALCADAVAGGVGDEWVVLLASGIRGVGGAVLRFRSKHFTHGRQCTHRTCLMSVVAP